MRLQDLALRLLGSTSGETILRSAAAASGAITLPAGTTDFSATGGASQVVRQSAAGGPFTVGQLAASDVSGALTTSGVSGMTAGQIPIAATATTITSSGNLSGAVTTSGSMATTLAANAVATAHITNANVTYAKIQNVAANRLLGNSTGSAAAPDEIALPLAVALGGTNATTAAAALTSLGAAPLASPSFTGNVTVAGGVKVGGGANPALGIAFGQYTSVWAPDGSGAAAGVFVGDTAAGALLYRNSSHQFADRPGSTTFVQIVAGGMTIGAPTGGAKGAGTLNATGVYANGTLLTSDARLKRDVEPLPDGCLDCVKAIEPKMFRWAEPDEAARRRFDPMTGQEGEPLTLEEMAPPGFYERRNWEFTAQDIRAVLPDAVEEDSEGNLSYSPSDLTAVLWCAVQELSAKVAALEGREPAA